MLVSLPLLIRTLIPSGGPTLMTSPKPDYLPKASTSKYITSKEVLDFKAQIWGETQIFSPEHCVRKFTRFFIIKPQNTFPAQATHISVRPSLFLLNSLFKLDTFSSL